MLRALVLGGASCVWDDAEAALELFAPDMVVAVNDIGMCWAGCLSHWVTLHPEKMADWRHERAMRGFKKAGHHVSNVEAEGISDVCDYRWPGMTGSGSSGLFAVKVAMGAGAGRIVLSGVPMQAAGAHFFNGSPWFEVGSFIAAWRDAYPHIKNYVRSCSGWTQELLGEPTPAWLSG